MTRKFDNFLARREGLNYTEQSVHEDTVYNPIISGDKAAWALQTQVVSSFSDISGCTMFIHELCMPALKNPKALTSTTLMGISRKYE